LLAFDDGEKKHFQSLATTYRDVDFDAWRDTERQVIQERIRMTKLPANNRTG